MSIARLLVSRLMDETKLTKIVPSHRRLLTHSKIPDDTKRNYEK